MSTTNVKPKRKLTKSLPHKPLPTAPQKSLPVTPAKNKTKKPPRSTSYKTTDKKNEQPSQPPNNQQTNRGNRAQTFSYSTHTEQNNNGTTMTYTYKTTYAFQPAHSTNNNNSSKPPPETIITFNNNLTRSNSTNSQPETVISFTNNQTQNNNNSQPNTVITFTKPTTRTTRTRTMSNHKPQSSYHKMLPLAPTIQNANMEYCYLDKVVLNDNRQGTIKYIGEISIDLKGEIWYGIQLTDARGQNNGSLRGQKYFQCPTKYGTFVQKKNIRWLEIDESDAEIDLDAENRYHINEMVRIRNKKGKAQIRCICEIDKQLKFGVELFNDMGSHSGIVNGKFYFTCGFYKGLFVNKETLISLKNGDPIKDEKKEKIRQSPKLDVINIKDHSDHSDHSDSDSDASDESVSMGDSGNFFDRIELNEEDENMMFSHILNKLKADGRNAQQSDSDSEDAENKQIEYAQEIVINDEEEKMAETDYKSNIKPMEITLPQISVDHSVESVHSLCASETSPAVNIYANAAVSPVFDIEPTKKLSIIMTSHDQNIHHISPQSQSNNNDKIEPVQGLTLPQGSMHLPKVPAITTARLSNLATPPTGNDILSPMFSPLQTPVVGAGSGGLQTPVSVEQLNAKFIKYTKDNCHLKEFPDSPFDVNTTKREFSNCATTIQLGCNNPHKLFKILHAMVGKLYLNTMKYRSLNLNSNKIKTKLLNYDGVEEFFNLLGFEQHGNKLECELHQPPLSVLKDSVNVLTKFIQKTGRKRAVVDMIKKFHTINLDALQTDIIEAENSRDTPNKISTPIISIDSFSAMVQQRNESEIIKEKAKKEIEKIEKVIEQVITPVPTNDIFDDEIEPEPEPQLTDIINDEEEDDDEEEEDDHFKLGDIINSITHPQNNDISAISIVLLCYPLFSESTELFKCLKKRFLHNDNEFIIQQKVIAFINEWINKYWDEDWVSHNELKKVFDEFVDVIIDTKTDDKYQNMVDYLLDIQSKQQNKILTNILNNKYGFTRVDRTLQKEEKLYDTYSIKFDQFFKLNNNVICKQMILMDFEYFSKIKSRECVGQSWKKKNKYEIAPNICNCIDHFNRMTLWVQMRILLCDNIKKRCKIIKKFIKICEILFSLRSFQSLYSVYAGLNSSPILRLKKAWNCVATKHLAKYEEFKVIFSSKRNMANLRKLHRETYPPMIPYLGIFLQDLFQIEEGNSKTKEDGTINFGILIRLTNVIDQMVNYQKYKYTNIKINKNMQKLLCNELRLNQNLNENIIWKLSDKAKKNDEKKRLFRK